MEVSSVQYSTNSAQIENTFMCLSVRLVFCYTILEHFRTYNYVCSKTTLRWGQNDSIGGKRLCIGGETILYCGRNDFVLGTKRLGGEMNLLHSQCTKKFINFPIEVYIYYVKTSLWNFSAPTVIIIKPLTAFNFTKLI